MSRGETQIKKPTESANIAIVHKEPMMLMVSTQDTKKEWVTDSGCTFHSTPEKEVLLECSWLTTLMETLKELGKLEYKFQMALK